MVQKIRVQRDGHDVFIIAEKIAGKLWFHLDGVTHVYEPAAEKKESKNGPLHTDRIEAPMPGKVLRVEVKVGDTVQPGQVVIVMEAMKMEYTLAAAAAATIAEVGCQAGDQVKLGQILVRFKGSKDV